MGAFSKLPPVSPILTESAGCFDCRSGSARRLRIRPPAALDPIVRDFSHVTCAASRNVADGELGAMVGRLAFRAAFSLGPRFPSAQKRPLLPLGRSRKPPRSEERRVGKECRSRRWPQYENKKGT